MWSSARQLLVPCAHWQSNCCQHCGRASITPASTKKMARRPAASGWNKYLSLAFCCTSSPRWRHTWWGQVWCFHSKTPLPYILYSSMVYLVCILPMQLLFQLSKLSSQCEVWAFFLSSAEGGADHVGRHQSRPVGLGQSHCVLQATGRWVSSCK